MLRYVISINFHFLLFFMFLWVGCARIVMPSGGPKDTTPPSVVGGKPENGSTNFNGKIIKITFDEFVTLNNPIENVIFSPPLNNRIEYLTQGKSILLKIRDTLQANTTYNVFFSNGIQDYHEGNRLESYNYAFSTGDSIDLYKLFGKVENAQTNKPETDCLVMLYENNTDSLPLTTRPDYITKTNKNGEFIFQYLKPKNYKIFALKDINSDMKYNLPNEFIAFLDTTVTVKFYATDSLLRADKASFIFLRMFQEEDTVQLLSPYLNFQKGVYQFPYKIPVQDFSFQIESDTSVDFFSKINPTRDTLSMYLKTFFTGSAIVYIQTDTARRDTVELLPYSTPQHIGKNKPAVKEKLNINISNKEDLYAPTLLNFSYPVKPVDSAKLLVIATLRSGKDTSVVYVRIPDSLVMQLPISFTFEPKINYTLWLADSVFFGYDGTTNDTLQFSFSKKTEKDYGNLIVHYKVAEANDMDYIVELQSSNQKSIQKNIVSYSKTIEYKHITPGSYRIKVIEDRNKNGKWDTGNYRKKRQPERIYFIDKDITIRGFWDIEEDIELGIP